MIQTINRYDFRDAFHAIRPDNFSYDGLSILFDFLEELEADCGEQIELDVIALCCDYSEESPAAIAASYDLEGDDLETVLEFLNDQTFVVGVTDNGTIVYCSAF